MKEINYLRSLIRRLLKEGRNYTDGENCVFCEGITRYGFVNCGIHALDCVGNESRKYLKKSQVERKSIYK